MPITDQLDHAYIVDPVVEVGLGLSAGRAPY